MTNLALLPLLPLWPPPRPHLRLLCCTRANRPSAAAASAPLAGRTTLALARAEHGAQDVRLQERPAAFAVEQGYPPRDRRAIAPELDLRHALEHADEPPDAHATRAPRPERDGGEREPVDPVWPELWPALGSRRRPSGVLQLQRGFNDELNCNLCGLYCKLVGPFYSLSFGRVG